MIRCDPATVLPLDRAHVAVLRTKYGLAFDPDYERSVAQFNGGTPLAPFFSLGEAVFRIGWMVALLDYNAALPGPRQPAVYYHEYDTRVEDRSLPSLIDHEIDPFFWAERIIPFAALYTHSKPPRSLRLYSYDWNPSDSLCFDRSTTPQSVVVCSADMQVAEYMRGEDDWDAAAREGREPDDEVHYDRFLSTVAGSFAAFCTMLRAEP